MDRGGVDIKVDKMVLGMSVGGESGGMSTSDVEGSGVSRSDRGLEVEEREEDAEVVLSFTGEGERRGNLGGEGGRGVEDGRDRVEEATLTCE